MLNTNPFVLHRFNKLEHFLDDYVVESRFSLEAVKQSMSSRFVKSEYDSSYRLLFQDKYSFYARLYWVAEDAGPTPYIHIELAFLQLPGAWSHHSQFSEFLLELNNGFHDPIKLARLDDQTIGLVVRGRIDKVTPDYWEGLISDLRECAKEIEEKLQRRFGKGIASMAEYLSQFPEKLSK